MYLGTWQIDDLLVFSVSTHDVATGVATDADSVPTYRVYEDETGTAILTGSMALLDSSNTAGFYSEQITLSAANGFEEGKSYNIYIAATVDSVTGTTSRSFQVEAALATAAALATVATYVDTEVAALVTAVADIPTNSELTTALSDLPTNSELTTALADLPTNAELATALGTADDATLAAIAALNNLSSAQAQTAAAAALTAYDPPTHAELTSGLAAADDATLAAIAALNNLSAAQVNAEVDTAISDAGLVAAVADLPTNAELATALGTADDATLAAIAALNNLSSAQAQTAATAALNAYDPPTNAELTAATSPLATAAALSTVAGYFDTEIAAILADTGTDGVVISTTTAQAIADVILARAVSNVQASADINSLAALILATFHSVMDGTDWTIYRIDDSTVFSTPTITTDADAEPVTGAAA